MTTPGATADRDASGLAGRRGRRFGSLVLCSPGLLVVAFAVLAPVLWMFWLSIYEDGAFTLVHYERLINSPTYTKVFITTFQVSVSVTVLCIVLGYPTAYLISHMPPRRANLCLLAVILPFWTSLLVRTYAWLVLLQREGLLNASLQKIGLTDGPVQLVHNMTGTIIGMVHIMLPFFILPLYASMKSIEGDYVRAAQSLGANSFNAFWRVFLPLSAPGLAAGTLLVFILCLGFFVTPALLGGGRVIMIAMRIERSVALFPSWGAASALGVVLLVCTLLILAVAGKAGSRTVVGGKAG